MISTLKSFLSISILTLLVPITFLKWKRNGPKKLDRDISDKLL